MTFVHWAEQQWILNLLLFTQLLWQDKICINFCCTSCTFKNLSNSMPSSSRVPVSWCSIAIGIAANALFFSRFWDPKTRGSVMKSLQNLRWRSLLFETSESTVPYICGYHNQNDFHGFLVSSFQIVLSG